MPQSNTTAVLEDGVLTVTTDQRPEPALFGDPLGSGNFPNNPNSVDSQTNPDGFAFTMRAGTNTSNPQATTLGPQGIALNGVVIFNPSAGPGPLPGQTVFPRYSRPAGRSHSPRSGRRPGQTSPSSLRGGRFRDHPTTLQLRIL